MNNHIIKAMQWVVFGLLFAGLITLWMHVDEHGILINAGFITAGLSGLLAAIRARYYERLNQETSRFILPLVIIILAADNLFAENPQYTLLGFAIILQYLIELRKGVLWKN